MSNTINNHTMQFPYRYIARIIVEAETPLAVGSATMLEDQDSPVAKDFNNLPYIPGTAIAGWLRHKFDNTGIIEYFGDDPGDNNSQTKGSNLITSDALLMNIDNKVFQQVADIQNDNFLKRFLDLPIRQHVAIDIKGTAKDGSLFDSEVVYKGSRFKFEISLELPQEDDTAWGEILQAFNSDDFYIGGGQFDGYGKLKVIEIKEKKFDLNTQLDDYLNITVDLNESIEDAQNFEFEKEITRTYEYIEHKLTGVNSFHHFGAGYGDNEVDHINYKEYVVDYSDNNMPFKSKFVIPGTSIKGALAHRVAYYYNLENGKTVEELINLPAKLPEDLEGLKTIKEQLEQLNLKEKLENAAYENNEAVKSLFGTAKDSKNNKGASGEVIIHDIWIDGETKETKETKEHIFYHNKIDRFTGGTVDGALYSEKVLNIDEVTLRIAVKKDNPNKKYLEMAISDLLEGRLPVGGKVNKGHGIFNELKNTES